MHNAQGLPLPCRDMRRQTDELHEPAPGAHALTYGELNVTTSFYQFRVNLMVRLCLQDTDWSFEDFPGSVREPKCLAPWSAGYMCEVQHSCCVPSSQMPPALLRRLISSQIKCSLSGCCLGSYWHCWPPCQQAPKPLTAFTPPQNLNSSSAGPPCPLAQRNFLMYWRFPEYNLIRLLVTLLVAFLFGTLFWDQGTQR